MATPWEIQFWKWLHPRFPRPHWRVESRTCSGLPDVFTTVDGLGVWVELKSVRKQWPLTVPHLTPIQAATGRMLCTCQGLLSFFLFELREDGKHSDVVLLRADRLPDPLTLSDSALRRVCSGWWTKRNFDQAAFKAALTDRS